MKRVFFLKRQLTFLIATVLAVLIITGMTTNYPGNNDTVVEAAYYQVPTVAFNRATDSVIEPDDGNTVAREITVIISAAPAQDEAVTVEYTTANGSATAGIDYVATSGTLTFPAGSSDSQTFDVTVVGNNQTQPDRTFIVFLTNPQNASVGAPSSITVTIVDNDTATPTHTPTGTPGGTVFLDEYEPNNFPVTAFTTSANAAKLEGSTLWPVGDIDYFQFFGKKGSTYQIYTTDVAAGLDTFLKVFNPNGDKIAENDDVEVANTRSQVEVTVNEDGFYFAEIVNKDPTDPTNKTYAFGVDEILPPTPTPTPTRVGQLDSCEPNNTLDTSCLIGPGAVKSNMNFIPPQGIEQDTDFYRLPVIPGVLYTCETQNLSAVNDTNIIFLDNNGNDFNPQLGNNDRAPGDTSSLLSWFSTYQGNLYVVVGPVNVPPYNETPQYTYDIVCNAVAASPTPPPTATTAFVPPSNGGTGGTGGNVLPTNTPAVFPTFPPTPTPIDFSNLAPTAVPPPIVGFQPLPTATPIAAAQQTTTVQVTVYYDSNFNFTPELTEGIMDVAVELYDNSTGELLAFGYSNEAGVIRFDSIVSLGAIRVEVPYLNYSQVVAGASANILLRVEPRPLPSGIP